MNTYEIYIDGDYWDEVEAIDEPGAIDVVFERLDGKVGEEIHAELVEGSEEPGICPACNGSGEGQHEGSRCHHCGGWGEA
jgi:hypothetical protein